MKILTTTLVGEVEMNARFAQFVSPEEILRERAFYSFLLSYAGREVEMRELVLLITEAMTTRLPLGTPFNIGKVIDAMVGEDGKEVGEATKRTFESVARLMAAKR